jgi:hypothetical protein
VAAVVVVAVVVLAAAAVVVVPVVAVVAVAIVVVAAVVVAVVVVAVVVVRGGDASNIYAPLVSSFLYVTLLAPRILWWLVDISKSFGETWGLVRDGWL